MKFGKAYVIPYTYISPKGPPENGAAFYIAGRYHGFIPRRALIPIANRLVDISEEYDKAGSTP